MNRLQEFITRMEVEGVIQLSSGIFKTHETPLGVQHKNTTPENYCIIMAKLHDITAEAYADQLLLIMDAPASKITGECRACFSFIIEGEEHICKNG